MEWVIRKATKMAIPPRLEIFRISPPFITGFNVEKRFFFTAK
jgi:hypothetical protein